MKTTKILPPAGKRKHKIIFEATFNKDYKKGGELDEVVSRTLGTMGFFNS